MEFTSYAHGVPCWVDVTAPDTARAAAFYGSLFGWDVPDGDPAFGGYRTATLGGRAVAGISPPMSPESPPAWSTYVASDDAAASLEAASAAGGTVLWGPTEVGPFGTMGVFADSQGAACAVWQAAAHIGAQVANEPGAFCWNELAARDADAAVGFYSRVFGWTAARHDGAMPYTEFHVDGRPIAGMMDMPPQVPAEVPSFWTVYFAVDDCDAAVARVVELGGGARMEPMEVSVGRFCAVHDDQGAGFSVIALTGPPPG